MVPRNGVSHERPDSTILQIEKSPPDIYLGLPNTPAARRERDSERVQLTGGT